jgi:prolipoprotein diacylglyceryltransferase
MLAGLDGPRATVLWWTLPSFMMLIAASFLLSCGILFWETRRSWKLSEAANSALIALALGLFLARMEHVILNWAYFATVPSEILNFAAGGLNAHGAIAGAAAGGWVSARLFRNSFNPWLSAAAYALCLLAAAAWWGCVAASCAYGAEVGNLADYPSWLVWEAQGDFLMVAPRYAVQPIGAIASVMLLGGIGLAAMLSISGRWRAALALAGTMLISFFLGFLRGDSGPMLGSLRVTQILDLILLGTGVLLAAWPRRQSGPAA